MTSIEEAPDDEILLRVLQMYIVGPSILTRLSGVFSTLFTAGRCHCIASIMLDGKRSKSCQLYSQIWLYLPMIVAN